MKRTDLLDVTRNETGNQRWRDRRDSYRPAGETIKPTEYEVAPIADDGTAKAFVLGHHYSGSYPAARYRFGLYRRGERGELVGVAVFSHPCSDRVLTNVFPGEALESAELGRFVLLDSVPGNGETWFLARCFEGLRREGLIGIVSFSDPVPRATSDGAVVFPGHIGTIYQAHNAIYLGRATPRTLRLLPDGTVLSDRAVQKIRAKERGWRYAVELLERHGADAPDDDLAGWLNLWSGRLTRRVRHPGNHKFAWSLHPTARRQLALSLPYPKKVPA
jgi:hypothetical protein